MELVPQSLHWHIEVALRLAQPGRRASARNEQAEIQHQSTPGDGAFRFCILLNVSLTLSPQFKLGLGRATICSSRAELNEVGAVLNAVGPKSTVHSDDEENHQPDRPCYSINDRDWRSAQARRYFRQCDLIRVGEKFDHGGLHRTAPGNWVRERIPKPGPPSSSDPVPGLPRNFYNTEWINKQSEERIRWLDRQPEVPLEFPLHLRVYVRPVLWLSTQR